MNKETQYVFLKAMSDNGYEMNDPADCAKYLYQTKRLFERKLLTWYLIFIMDCFNAYIYVHVYIYMYINICIYMRLYEIIYIIHIYTCHICIIYILCLSYTGDTYIHIHICLICQEHKVQLEIYWCLVCGTFSWLAMDILE